MQDDIEILDLMKISNGFKYDQQKVNRQMLDRIKVKYMPSGEQRSVLGDSNDRYNRSSPKRGLNTVNKEIIYSKIDLQE